MRPEAVRLSVIFPTDVTHLCENFLARAMYPFYVALVTDDQRSVVFIAAIPSTGNAATDLGNEDCGP